jgi:hypothetical protein
LTKARSVIHSKFYVTVEFADDQPGMSPDSEGEGTVAKIRIKLIGHYVLSMMDEDIVKVDFTCPTDDIAIPKDMKSFGTAIFDFLQNAAERYTAHNMFLMRKRLTDIL